jgi:hypothetical protein
MLFVRTEKSLSSAKHCGRTRSGFMAVTAAAMLFSGSTLAQDPNQGPPPAVMQMMKEQMSLMTPELQQKVKALSPQTKMALAKIYTQHTRRSDTLTLRQVMHEVLADYQDTMAGIVTDNAEQAADSARRLANHRLPRGGLLPYMKLEDVNDEKLAVLVPFNDSVEGNALRLAEAAEKGDMALASRYMGDIANGCVACHQVFRGTPGLSARLR